MTHPHALRFPGRVAREDAPLSQDTGRRFFEEYSRTYE